VVVCLERGADLHTAQMMPLPLSVSCFSSLKSGLVLHVSGTGSPGSPGKRAIKARARVCVRVSVILLVADVVLINSVRFSFRAVNDA